MWSEAFCELQIINFKKPEVFGIFIDTLLLLFIFLCVFQFTLSVVLQTIIFRNHMLFAPRSENRLQCDCYLDIKSVVSNANLSSIERVRAPVFEYFWARTSPSIIYLNIERDEHHKFVKWILRNQKFLAFLLTLYCCFSSFFVCFNLHCLWSYKL